jgi:DNA-binding MarR family transcriptional regulator
VRSPRRPSANGGDALPGADGAAGAGTPADHDLARSAWQVMSDFVRRHDPGDELRRALGLGRGAGRVRALMSLAGGPLTLAELAQQLGIDPPYATVIANELQALGLLARTRDDRDRRRKPVELTARGHDAARTARDIITRPPSPLRSMPASDLVRLRDLLEQLSRPQQDPGTHR